MKAFKHLIIVIFITLMFGCTGPIVHIQEIDPLITNRVIIHPNNLILQKEGVKVLGIVDATSCKHLAWEPPASLENCTSQMQMKAAKLGANGLIVGGAERQVADLIKTGINRNCWSTVDCTGIAIIVTQNNTEGN